MKSMAKAVAKRNVGMEILEGLRQLKRGEVGRVITVPPVATIRERTGLSQVKFASLLGVSGRTLRECGHWLGAQHCPRTSGSRSDFSWLILSRGLVPIDCTRNPTAVLTLPRSVGSQAEVHRRMTTGLGR